MIICRELVSRFLIVTLVLTVPSPLIAEPVQIPFGTTVFIEMDQRVTSKKKETSAGDIVKAHVWKDVLVDGQLVVAAGTPVYARVSEVQKARIAGRKGTLAIEALNVAGIDGRDIPLDGGYDQSGKGRMGTAITLAVLVAWPLIFIKGKQAVLEKGAIFDAIVRSPVSIEARDTSARNVAIAKRNLSFEVLYDSIDTSQKLRKLPVRILSSEPISSASVIATNGVRLTHFIPITLTKENHRNDGAHSYLGQIPFKKLSKSFRAGMNRFEIKAGLETAEVLLELEL